MVGSQDSMILFVTNELMFHKLSPRFLNELVAIAEELQISYHNRLVDRFTDSLAYVQNKIEPCSIGIFH